MAKYDQKSEPTSTVAAWRDTTGKSAFPFRTAYYNIDVSSGCRAFYETGSRIGDKEARKLVGGAFQHQIRGLHGAA